MGPGGLENDLHRDYTSVYNQIFTEFNISTLLQRLTSHLAVLPLRLYQSKRWFHNSRPTSNSSRCTFFFTVRVNELRQMEVVNPFVPTSILWGITCFHLLVEILFSPCLFTQIVCGYVFCYRGVGVAGKLTGAKTSHTSTHVSNLCSSYVAHSHTDTRKFDLTRPGGVRSRAERVLDFFLLVGHDVSHPRGGLYGHCAGCGWRRCSHGRRGGVGDSPVVHPVRLQHGAS